MNRPIIPAAGQPHQVDGALSSIVTRENGGPPGGRTQNPRILGPLLWLFVDGADYLRLSRLQTPVVCGHLELYGCVL